MSQIVVCGSINWDTILTVDNFAKEGEEVKVKEVTYFAGGKGGNTAVAAAKILNGGVSIIGSVGNDYIGDIQLEEFRKSKVDTSLIVRKDVASGQAYVIIDKNGENIIYTYKAANYMLSVEDIERIEVIDAVDKAKIVIVTDTRLEVADRLIEIANKKNKLIIFMPALLTNYGLDKLTTLLKKSNFIILNEHEMKNLVKDGSEEDILPSLGKVIKTMGRQGCLLYLGKKRIVIPGIDLELFGMKSISSVGAGDTFAGSFAAFLLSFGEVESLFLASIAAALKTTREGPRDSPTYEEIKRYLNDPRMELIYKKIRVI